MHSESGSDTGPANRRSLSVIDVNAILNTELPEPETINLVLRFPAPSAKR